MTTLLVMLVDRVTRHHVAALLALAGCSILTGAALFSATQGVPLGTSLYWAITTATTVGYGDVTPHDGTGRVIAIGVMLTTIPVFGAVFAILAGMAALIQVRRSFGMNETVFAGAFRVVYGLHPAVPTIVDELAGDGRAVVLVADIAPGDAPPGVRLIAGDPTNETVIRKSRPDRAEHALVTGTDDGDVLVTAVALRALAPRLPISALTGSSKVSQALRELGIAHTLSADQLVGHVLAKGLEAPHATDLLLALVDSNEYEIVEIPPAPDERSRRLSDVRGRRADLVLGVVRGGTVTVGDDDPTLDASDRLLVLARRVRRG